MATLELPDWGGDGFRKLYSAFSPMAKLLLPVLFESAFNPTAVLCCDDGALVRNAPYPTAVLFNPR
jgi:hypothetical protein